MSRLNLPKDVWFCIMNFLELKDVKDMMSLWIPSVYRGLRMFCAHYPVRKEILLDTMSYHPQTAELIVDTNDLKSLRYFIDTHPFIESVRKDILKDASESGRLEVIKMMNHSDCIERCCLAAIKFENLDIVEYFAEKGHIYESVFREVCGGNQLELAKYLYKLQPGINLLSGFYLACAYGAIDCVNYLISLGVDDWNEGLSLASRNNRLSIVKIMIARGATNFNECLLECTELLKNWFRRYELEKILAKKATNRNECLLIAWKLMEIRYAKILIESGATNLNDCLTISCKAGNKGHVAFIIKHGASFCSHCKSDHK